MCGHIVCQHPLDHDLSPAVGTGGLDGRHLFLIRMRIVGAVNGGRRREDKLLAVKLFHHFQQRECAVQIVAVVLQRFLYTLAYCLESCKMDDGIDFMSRKYGAQRILTLAIQLIKCRTLAGDGLNAVNNICFCIGKVIHDNGCMTCLNQFYYSMTADISGAACD